jgi:2-dehydro-3-deoxygluconokinase
MTAALVALGEPMLELATADGQSWHLGVGGDMFNAAVYLARLGIAAALLTALGEDGMSQRVRSALAEEAVSDRLLLVHPSRTVGLYAIETDAAGERCFHYWRDSSAARDLWAAPGIDEALAAAARAPLLLLSGITLSLFNAAGRERLAALAHAVRENGGRVAFDPNYRPRGWPDVATARTAIAAFAPLVDIALPTFEDEAALFGHADPAQSLAWWRAAGAGEVALKCGAMGALLADGAPIPVPEAVAPVDTTGAGDSFNAAYLAGRLAGVPPAGSALAGNRLAARVVRHRGAIIPRAAMA